MGILIAAFSLVIGILLSVIVVMAVNLKLEKAKFALASYQLKKEVKKSGQVDLYEEYLELLREENDHLTQKVDQLNREVRHAVKVQLMLLTQQQVVLPIETGPSNN